MRSGLSRRVRGVLQLHPGEGRTVALAVAVAFLAQAGIMIAQNSIDALFFARYGVDRLPLMYLLVAVAMFATTVGVAVLLARLGRGRSFLLIPALICVAALAGRVAVETGESWIYGALWLVRNVAEFIQLLAVWGLAGMVADTRQAKRFFPVIAAGSVLGLIVGGIATGPLATALGSDNLLLVWAALIAGATAFAWRLMQTRVPTATAAAPRNRRHVSGLSGGFGDVRRSPLLRWMSFGDVLMALLFSLLYLAFSQAAVARYPDAEELAGFFGLFFAIALGTALVISLLVTSRLLARFGVATVVLILPVVYLVAFGVLAVGATFASLLLFRFAQVAWSSGGANSTWEALINTIPPDRRDRARAFLYGVPWQLGTVIAGIVALIAQRQDEPRLLYGAGLTGAVLAVVSIARVRTAYPRALVAALRAGRPTIFGAPGGPQPAVLVADATGLAVLEMLLGDRDVRIRRLAAHAIGDLDLEGAQRALLRAVEDEDGQVRMVALESLVRLDRRFATEVAHARLSDPESSVRLAALHVLARSGIVPDEAMLEDRAPEVRALAAALLLGRADDAESVLAEIADGPDAETRAAGLRAIATARNPHAHSLVLDRVGDPEPAVRAEAVLALPAVGPDQAVAPLVAALADPVARVRDAAAEALAQLGPPAVDAVADALFDSRKEGALAALERLPLDGAAERVRRFASASVERALEDTQLQDGLGTTGGSAVELLRDSLGARAERHALEALRAAALLGDRSAVAVALDSLTVADAAQRANAVELIETVGEPAIVRPLLALWEPRRAGRLDPQAIDQLRNDSDDWIRACADVASAALKGGEMTQTLATLPLVERVVFLRKVPLLAALPPQELQPIAAVAEEHAFAEGDTLAERGEPGDTMYIIVEGEVEVRGADERELAVRSPGDVIGEMAVISSRPRMASLVAKSSVRVLEIHKAAFEAILRERPETALAMMRVLSERLAASGATTE